MDRKDVKDLETFAYVLRRTNYGEADRILNLITPEGKISVMARGVRKAKSKLAGSIEMFTCSRVNLHFGRGDLATLTGAKMEKFQAEILKDFDKMELAGEILRVTERVTEGVADSGYYKIVDMALTELNNGAETRLVETWFFLNVAKLSGEEVNFYRDSEGEKLEAGAKYSWDKNERALRCDDGGEIDANVIKILRLMVSADLAVIKKIRGVEEYLPVLVKIGKVFREVVK